MFEASALPIRGGDSDEQWPGRELQWVEWKNGLRDRAAWHFRASSGSGRRVVRLPVRWLPHVAPTRRLRHCPLCFWEDDGQDEHDERGAAAARSDLRSEFTSSWLMRNLCRGTLARWQAWAGRSNPTEQPGARARFGPSGDARVWAMSCGSGRSDSCREPRPTGTGPWTWLAAAVLLLSFGWVPTRSSEPACMSTLDEKGITLAGFVANPAFPGEQVAKVIADFKVRGVYAFAVAIGNPWPARCFALALSTYAQPLDVRHDPELIALKGIDVDWWAEWYPGDPRSHIRQPPNDAPVDGWFVYRRSRRYGDADLPRKAVRQPARPPNTASPYTRRA